MRKIDPHKSITDVVMFDRDSNVHLDGELLKIHYPNILVMRGVEHTVSLFCWAVCAFKSVISALLS